jgi:putative ABC transport system permease protein
VLQQAVALALLGFLPGLALAEVLYRVTTHVAHLPVEMNVPRVLLVLAASVGMCAISGLGALRKVRASDPADLF